MSEKKRKPNRLIHEKSPYLLQHAYNPVDWYPWSEEAFKKAEVMDKPIFLSIGYSTCHWCHIMEKESFNNLEIAKLLNETFICIKVDREERPDIDKFYMTVCQLVRGSCGWPLNILMTPDKKPFYVATYLPPESRYGYMGLKELIIKTRELWENKRDEIFDVAEKISNLLLDVEERIVKKVTEKRPTEILLQKGYEYFRALYDREFGGFGDSPKFPIPHNLIFLMRYWYRTKEGDALEMAIETLKRMRMGGIYDHVGCGFHRYSTDRLWLLPHFEKMLYDQALHIMAYTEAYHTTGEKYFLKTVEEIVEFLDRDMKNKDGGFYTAIDADSEEGEGVYYLWRYNELEELLDKEEFKIFKEVFNITREGNYLDEATKVRTGLNVLYRNKDFNKLSKILGMEETDIENITRKSLKKLYEARKNRPPPNIDDKILTDWNGLIIAALSMAYQVINNEKYLKLAIEASEFIWERMVDGTELLHRYRDGEAAIPGFLDDYSSLLWGMIELYMATFNSKYLERAIVLAEEMTKSFWDEDSKLFFHTSRNYHDIPIRKREIYDSSIPSGNGVATYNLIRLSHLTGNTKYLDKGRIIVEHLSEEIEKIPGGYTSLLLSLDYLLGPSKEIVIVGNKNSDDTNNMIKISRSIYMPRKVILIKDPHDKILEKYVDYIKYYNMIGNKATAYVCSNYTCKEPTKDIDKFIKYLFLALTPSSSYK